MSTKTRSVQASSAGKEGGFRISGVGGVGGSTAAASGGSDINFLYGKRKMKAYPITEDELDRIADLGLYSTICFSLAGACVGLAINFQKDQMLNTSLPPGVGETWEVLKWMSFGISALSGILGFVLTRRRRSQVQRIKDESSFA